jgi:dinuclear metal center YbgI/SA1388 family protein
MKIKEITSYLETIAPSDLQESYDNAGLVVGNADMEISGVLISLDCIEEVVDEAIANNCNLIVAHHPIVFGGLKKINGKNYVERTVIKAIKNDIAIYAIHTNLDNVYEGVNKRIADKLGLLRTHILSPKPNLLKKLVTFVPVEFAEKVKQAIFDAGAGHIGNYGECSFAASGIGSFKASGDAKPFVGEIDKQQQEQELRLETIFPTFLQTQILAALIKVHPYEEVAYDIYPIENFYEKTGAGLVGELETEMRPEEFLKHLKNSMDLEIIRFTSLSKNIKRVAVCGGAGSFLLKNAIWQGADAYVTADFKYHEFFDAEKKLMIADIGHYESEKFTKELLSELILKKFHTFAVLLSKTNTNPVNYYY